MQINTYSMPQYSNSQHVHKLEQAYQEKISKNEKVEDNNQDSKINASLELGELPRQTYGLSILEQMSDDEYRAFLRATVEMSESEKIFAAQSLYRLHGVYEQQFTKKKNPYQINDQDFIQIFQHAYAEVLNQKFS